MMFKSKTFLIGVLTAFIISGCTSDQEYNNLKKQLDELNKQLGEKNKELDEFKKQKLNIDEELNTCKKNYDEILNSSLQRITKARKLFHDKEYEYAKKEYLAIIEKFPFSIEAKNSEEELKKIDEIISKQKFEEKNRIELEEKKKILGFKILKESLIKDIDYNTIKFETINVSNKWIFDSNGYEYYYNTAERDSKLITAKVKITSKIKEPKLPQILVYQMVNNKLIYIDSFRYKFNRWKDYGSYLGNYGDDSNDFNYTKTITFSLGVQVLEKDLKNNSIFVVAKNNNCVEKNYNQYSKPKYSYNDYNCEIQKPILTIEDFEKDYTLIKIFNKDKL